MFKDFREPLCAAATLMLLLSGCRLFVAAAIPDSQAPPAREAVSMIRGSLREDFAPGRFEGSNGVRLVYRLLAPPKPGERVPLVVMLHGSGAIGDDNLAQLGDLSLSWAQPEIRHWFHAYVLVPQFPARTADYSSGELPASIARPPLDAALELVDSICRTLPIEQDRIYVVGFSMGGSAAWHALLRRPDRFAAMVSISGVPPDRSLAATIPPIPLLVIHGTEDRENPFAATKAMVETLQWFPRKELLWQPIRGLDHTIPQDVIHGTWWRDWLFAQRRPGKADQPPAIRTSVPPPQ